MKSKVVTREEALSRIHDGQTIMFGDWHFFKDGDFVNLGIGVPLMCVNYLPEGVDLWLEAEIGTVGSGPTPSWDEADIDVIDAGFILL